MERLLILYKGRTGRFGRQGISVNFVYNDKSYRDMQVFEAALGRKITKVPTDDVDVMERVGRFCLIVAS